MILNPLYAFAQNRQYTAFIFIRGKSRGMSVAQQKLVPPVMMAEVLAATPKRAASRKAKPLDSPIAKPPISESPAPTLLLAFTAGVET